MCRFAPLVALLLILVGFAGCSDPNRTAPNRNVREAWEQERDAHGPLGVAASFDLLGSPLLVTGTGEASTLRAPLDLRPSPTLGAQKPYLYLVGAVVVGKGQGTLVLEGSEIHASGGSIQNVDLSEVQIDNRLSIRFRSDTPQPRPDLIFPPGWEDANESLFFAEAFQPLVQDLVLENYTRAVLFNSAQNWTLEGPVTIGAFQEWWWDDQSRLFTTSGFDARWDRFSLGGNVTSGTLEPEGKPTVQAPKGVFGRDASLHLELGRARSVGTFRLTQAINGTGLYLPAMVEVLSEAQAFTVPRGQTRWVSASFREKAYLGDAILKDVTITGSGKDLVRVPVERPPLIIQQLFAWVEQAARDVGWPAAFLAIAVTLTSPAVLMVDALLAIVCAFSVCPEQYPYPLWMDSGDVDVFYFKIDGNAALGSYEATITLQGKNYPPVELPLSITVTAPSPSS